MNQNEQYSYVVKYNPENNVITEIVPYQVQFDKYGDNPYYKYNVDYLQYEYNTAYIYLFSLGRRGYWIDPETGQEQYGYIEYGPDYSYLKVGDTLTPELMEKDEKFKWIMPAGRIARFQKGRISMMNYNATGFMEQPFIHFYQDAYYYNAIEETGLDAAVHKGLITAEQKQLILNSLFGRAEDGGQFVEGF